MNLLPLEDVSWWDYITNRFQRLSYILFRAADCMTVTRVLCTKYLVCLFFYIFVGRGAVGAETAYVFPVDAKIHIFFIVNSMLGVCS